jgi:DNA-damage-inducible protein D
MKEKRIAGKHHATFEGLRRLDEEGNEYWLARQLARVFKYSEYRHFLPVIERAREACRNSGREPEDHFEDVLEMVGIGSGVSVCRSGPCPRK